MASKVIVLAIATLFTAISVARSQREAKQKYCGGHEADLIFVMDSSGSIGAADFIEQKQFIKGMVDLFETDTGKIRVGVVSYSNWALLEFNLNGYTNKNDINAAIDQVQHYKGDTNTGSAIAYVRDVMFQEHNGARDGVPHIAIVLTDGRSNDPIFTMEQSALARDHNIALFAIGVGHDISTYELNSIASTQANNPHEKYVFQVSNYVALQYIKNMLAIKACEVPAPPRKYPTTPVSVPAPPRKYPTTTVSVPAPPRTYPTTTVTTDAPDLACKDTPTADIIYALSPAASPDSIDKTLNFYREMTNGLDISNGKIHVGLVPKDCGAVPQLYVGLKNQKDAVLHELDKMFDEQPTTASVLNYMRRKSFSVRNGARKDAKRIGVVFVDEGDDLLKTKYEARKAKEVHNIELYVVAVGKNVNAKKLRKIASEPFEEHFYNVLTYDHLPPILDRVRNSVCPPPNS